MSKDKGIRGVSISKIEIQNGEDHKLLRLRVSKVKVNHPICLMYPLHLNKLSNYWNCYHKLTWHLVPTVSLMKKYITHSLVMWPAHQL